MRRRDAFYWLAGRGELMAHSPHRRRKGCGLCSPHKHKDLGRAVRDPFSVRRKLGSKRRAGRHDVPEDADR